MISYRWDLDMSTTSDALGMSIPQPHVDTWNSSMGMVTTALEKVDAFAGDTATVESSPSTEAHDVGELLLYGGRLYKVTSSISVGDVLALGANVEAANLGEEVHGLSNGLNSLSDGITSSIASVEQTTAVSAHAVGDYFMLGNVLMKATSAISIGDQITTSNATPATVQAQIDTLRDSVSCELVTNKAHAQVSGITTLRLYRSGSACYIEAGGNAVTLSAGWNTIVTIDAPYRAKYTMGGIGMYPYGSLRDIKVEPSGNVDIYVPASDSTSLRYSLVYLIDVTSL